MLSQVLVKKRVACPSVSISPTTHLAGTVGFEGVFTRAGAEGFLPVLEPQH